MKDTTIFERVSELHVCNEINMYYCGKRINTNNHVYGPEIRDHYLFVLVNKGNATLYGNQQHSLKEHDLLVMCPGERIFYKAHTSWSIQWIGLHGRSIHELMILLGVNGNYPVIHISDYAEMESILEKIYSKSLDYSLDSQLSITSMIYEFFKILVQSKKYKSRIDLIESVEQIIEYNFNTSITIEQIAEKLHITPAYLSRIFTEKYGMPPKKYIINKRMARAKELLKNENVTIAEVSASIGYEDPLYFSRIFKKCEGVSPKQFVKLFSTKGSN